MAVSGETLIYACLAVAIGILGLLAAAAAWYERIAIHPPAGDAHHPEVAAWTEQLRRRQQELIRVSQRAIVVILSARVVVSLWLIASGICILAGHAVAVPWLRAAMAVLPVVALAAVSYDIWLKRALVRAGDAEVFNSAEVAPLLAALRCQARVGLIVCGIWLALQVTVSVLALARL